VISHILTVSKVQSPGCLIAQGVVDGRSGRKRGYERGVYPLLGKKVAAREIAEHWDTAGRGCSSAGQKGAFDEQASLDPAARR
jgi:hypothetical protein